MVQKGIYEKICIVHQAEVKVDDLNQGPFDGQPRAELSYVFAIFVYI